MDATLGLPILVGLIAVALLFDFLNGVHDAANSIATIVSTRVLRPQYAVLWAAFFNFVAFLVFGLHVANTIGTGIIEPSVIDAQVIFAALIGANVAMVTAITEEVTKLEGRVDDLHDIGLKELFLKHRNANTMDFIVGAEIYDHLEKVADRFDDVANEINSIVIEQV